MPKSLRILLAEDEETDVLLLRHALRRAGLTHELVVAQDGKEAIEYLSGRARGEDHPQCPMPALIVLDLKMPRMTGFDVLIWLQSQPDLKQLPALVLTSSDDAADKLRAQQLGAVDYLVKPDSLRGLVTVVQELQGKWLDRPD